MSMKETLVRAAEAVALPTGVVILADFAVHHAGSLGDGQVISSSEQIDKIHEHGPDVAIGAAAGTGASLIGGKAVEGACKVAAWISAPRNEKIRHSRAERMANSTISRGITFLLGVAAGIGSGYGRGAGAMVSGGLGGTGSGLLLSRKR